MASSSIYLKVSGKYYPCEPRRAWLRRHLPVMLWVWWFERKLTGIKWGLFVSWNAACPIPIPNDGEMWFMDPETLTPYPNNPRDNTEAIKVVRESIERFGYRSPIEIDANDEIVAGHTRREAAIGEGAQVVTVIKWTKMSGAESRAYRIAHNKTGERADWDEKKLIQELEAIFETNQSFEGLGFDTDELNELLAVPLPGDTDKSGITHTTEIECPKCRHKWRP